MTAGRFPSALEGADVLPLMDEEAPAMPRGNPKRKPADNVRGTRKQAGKAVAGRFGTLNTFIDESMRTLQPSESLVWLTLYRDARGDIATAGQGSIAERTGLALRTVKYAVQALIQRGFLKVVRRGNVGRPSTYSVVPKPRDDGR